MRELTPELRALHGLAAAAAKGTYEVGDLLERICFSLVESFDFKRVSISSLDDDGTLSPVAAKGISLDQLPTRIPVNSQSVFVRALETGEAVFVKDVGEEASLSREIVDALEVRSILVVPLVTEGRRLGFIQADRGAEAFELDEPTCDLLTTIGAVAAVFLAQALEQKALRQIDELKTNFVALASHELRTPAAVVHGIAATLHQRGDELTDEQLRELRHALFEQTDRLRGLVEQLLDLSRLEANGISIAPAPVNVHRRVQELALVLAGERARDVAIDVPPDLEPLIDATAFERIVSNLITNAFKYGTPPVLVTARQSDNHFRLAVEDRGDGVAPDFVPHLFERFTRSAESAETTHGAGLGLSIARSYAEAHGGQILYTRADPKGARFEVVLPRAKPVPAPAAE